jgi:hypothetical protein
MKKISNPKPEPRPPKFNRLKFALSRHLGQVVREVGVLPRALRYFLVLSVALHASLVFVGRQFSSATPKPAEKARSERTAPGKSLSRR